jgi:hypothetical protein
MNQGSRIKELQSKYGKYSEVLPEELYELSVQDELANNKLELIKIFDEDINFFHNLIQKSHKKIDLRQFENSDAYLIRRGFLQKMNISQVYNTRNILYLTYLCANRLYFFWRINYWIPCPSLTNIFRNQNRPQEKISALPS